MQQKPEKKTRTRRQKKGTSIERLEALGDDLVCHLNTIGSSWDDFCNFLSTAQEEPRLDTKRLRDFIAAYHELFRALLDVQPKEERKEAANPVVILPDILQEEEDA